MIDFNQRTKRLLATTTHGRIGIRNFQRIFPDVAVQIRADAQSDCFGLWGLSVNFDELQNQRIVDGKLLSTIGRLANYPIRHSNCVYNAGLIHTYGYLLSCLKTHYGYKRERWTRREIETGLGLAESLLSDNPRSGTLLQNATYVLAGIAFPSAVRRNLAQRCPGHAPSLLGFKFSQLAVTRITEVINIPGNQILGKNSSVAKAAKIELVTDIVKYKRRQGATRSASALLVYSYRVGNQQRLVTCFPVAKQMMADMIDVANRNEVPIRARFNLYLDGIPKEGLAGKRKVEKRRLG